LNSALNGISEIKPASSLMFFWEKALYCTVAMSSYTGSNRWQQVKVVNKTAASSKVHFALRFSTYNCSSSCARTKKTSYCLLNKLE